jgi:hypothetical protein
MAIAPPGILRRIPPSPPAPPADYQVLLGSKLRLLFDVRSGGEFAPGRWISHGAAVGGIRVRAPSVVRRPRVEVDGFGHFGGAGVIRLSPTNHLCMQAEKISNLVPVGTRVEGFLIGRANTLVVTGAVCGVVDTAASTQSGASFDADASAMVGYAGGNVPSAFTDTASPHMFSVDLGEDSLKRLRIDNAIVATGGAGAVTTATTQAAVGGFATGWTSSADFLIAQWGVISPPMTDAERARFLEIARNDWRF